MGKRPSLPTIPRSAKASARNAPQRRSKGKLSPQRKPRCSVASAEEGCFGGPGGADAGDAETGGVSSSLQIARGFPPVGNSGLPSFHICVLLGP